MASLHRIVIGAATWVALAGIYLVFAGEVSAVEIGAAVACAMLGTALALATHHFGKRQYRIRPPIRAVLRPLAALLFDFIAVARALGGAALGGGGRMRGDFLDQAFDRGGDDPRSGGRRALAVLGVSLAPRTFVVRESEGALLLHALPAKPPSDDEAWPA